MIYYKYQIPSRRTISRSIIPNLYVEVKHKIQLLLNEAKHISVVTDIWTSMYTSFIVIHYFIHDFFVAITVHF